MKTMEGRKFKTIQRFYVQLENGRSVEVSSGSVLGQISGHENLIDPLSGIVAEIEGVPAPIPFAYLSPEFDYQTTILLLHGFNSAPGNKEGIIKEWLAEKELGEKVIVIAPQLHYNPAEAIRQIGTIVQENYGNIVVIGTSLGGFYANYIRAVNPSERIKVHSLNPSWSPAESLKNEVKQQRNLKTNEDWYFEEAFLANLRVIEQKCKDSLKKYSGNHFTLHLAMQDELLKFDDLLAYLDANQVAHRLFHYDTNHRFEKVTEMLDNSIGDFQ